MKWIAVVALVIITAKIVVHEFRYCAVVLAKWEKDKRDEFFRHESPGESDSMYMQSSRHVFEKERTDTLTTLEEVPSGTSGRY